MARKRRNLERLLLSGDGSSPVTGRRDVCAKKRTLQSSHPELRKVPVDVSWLPVEEDYTAFQRSLSLLQTAAGSLGLPKVEPEAVLKNVSQLVHYRPVPYEAEGTVEAMVAMVDRTTEQASLYWNLIDQQIHELRVQILTLLSDQFRRLFLDVDDRIATASAARLILEVGLRMSVLVTFLRLAHGMLARDPDASRYHSHFRELSQFLYSNIVPTERECDLVNRSLKQETPPGPNWLERRFEPTTTEQFSIARYLAKARKDHGDGGKMESAVAALGDAYPILCKFVHPSPLMFHRSIRLHNMTDDKINAAVRATAIQVVAIVGMLSSEVKTSFWGTCQFLELHEMRVGLGATEPYAGSNEFLSKMMDKYKPLVMPGRDGDEVIFAYDDLSKAARKIGKEVEQLPEESRQRVRDFIKLEKQRGCRDSGRG